LRLSLNQPTAIRGDSSNIEAMIRQFEEIAQNHANIQASVVAVQKKDTE
jgi:hypothetical protein